MMKLELSDLIKTVWNPSAKNVRARPITGEVFIGEILWGQIQRFDVAVVRAAMVLELSEGNPPLVKNVAERCYEAVYGHEPSLSPARQYQDAEAYQRDEGRWASDDPFDEARRSDRGYVEKRLYVASIILFCGHARPRIFAECALYAGMTEIEFREYVAGQRDRGRKLPLLGVVNGVQLTST